MIQKTRADDGVVSVREGCEGIVMMKVMAVLVDSDGYVIQKMREDEDVGEIRQ